MFIARLLSTFVLFIFFSACALKPEPDVFQGIDSNRPLSGLIFVVFDFETTGFYAEVDEPIELGAVKFSYSSTGGWYFHGDFQTFIKSDKPIPQFITTLTGIRHEMLKDAPSPVEAINQFQTFIKDADFLVAHNAPFNLQFLGYNGSGSILSIKKPIIDSKRLVRAIFPQRRSYSLSSLVKDWHSKTERGFKAHRAENDSFAASRVFKKSFYEHTKQLKFKELRWHHLANIADISGALFSVADEYKRAFKPKEEENVSLKLPPDWREQVKRIGKRRHKQIKFNALSDIAREMGVSYEVLKKAMR